MNPRPLALGMLLCACSAGGGPLDIDLAGEWLGGTTLSAPGLALAEYATALKVSVTGNSAWVAGICPDGSGGLSATGQGDSASWNGTLVCPPFIWTRPSCTLGVTFTSFSMTLAPTGDRLDANGAGTVTCAGTAPMTAVLWGTLACLPSGRPCTPATAASCCNQHCDVDHHCL